MISNKRLNKIKLQLKKIGRKSDSDYVILVKEGIFKGEQGICTTENDYIKLDHIPNKLRVYDYSKCSVEDFMIISGSANHIMILNLSTPNPYGVDGGHIPEDVERALKEGEKMKNSNLNDNKRC